MCAHLVELGIDTELVEEGTSDDIESPSAFTPFKGLTFDVGIIRVAGTAFDAVQVTEFLSDTPPETAFTVKGHVEGNEARVTATTKTKRTGRIIKRAVDFTWNGGEIAKLLNRDRSLKEPMLDA